MKNKYDLSDIKERILVEPISAIAKEKGCCVSTIHWYLKRNNISIPILDLSGKKFNMIEVTRFAYSKNETKYWECLCQCGKYIYLSTSEINKGTAKSCGCYKKTKEFSRKNKQWGGHEDIHLKWWNNCIRGAKKRNIPFEITIEYAWDLYLKQDKRCNLTGLEISFSKTTKGWQYGETTASMDRIDPKLGYIEDNIQWIHKDVNFMKNDYTQEYFLQMIKLIYEKVNK